MKTAIQTDPDNAQLQERAIETLNDDSIPATRVLEERDDETGQNSAPLFIP